MSTLFSFLFALLSVSNTSADRDVEVSSTTFTTVDTLTWFDSSRQRKIPVAIYKSRQSKVNAKPAIIVFSHGYGQNRADSYTAYSYLCNFLAKKGYYVISVQHELVTDELIPTTGIPQLVRLPFWDRGADNILFVINELKRREFPLDYSDITLIGHSNGGDMTALFPVKYPGIVRRIITLDNRRMALPTTGLPLKVYSIRSSDQPADEGVLPSKEQMAILPIKIVTLASTRHNDMDETGTRKQHREIMLLIEGFLKED